MDTVKTEGSLQALTYPGMSNGGMFIWTRVMERLAGSVASAGTVCSAPLRGYDPAPDSPISIIDFHGRLDSTIPMSPEGPDNLGPGNQNILILIRFTVPYHCRKLHICCRT